MIAAVPVADAVGTADPVDVEVTDLAAVERAATLVHTGDMAECDRSDQVLQQWIDNANEVPFGLSREINLDCAAPRDRWVTELQFVLES